MTRPRQRRCSASGTTHAEIDALVKRNPAKRRSSSCTTGLLPGLDDDLPQSGSEGRLDLDFQFVMAVAPHVREYREQPERFRLRCGGRVRHYVPDGLAGTVLGPVYFEVKPKRILARSPDLDGRLDAIRAECARRDACFEIVTEDHVRAGHLLPNSIRVWSAAQSAEPERIRHACAALRDVDFPAELGSVVDLLGVEGWRLAMALVGMRLLAVDLTSQLDAETVVLRGGKDWA